jgi:hypothetical protein
MQVPEVDPFRYSADYTSNVLGPHTELAVTDLREALQQVHLHQLQLARSRCSVREASRQIVLTMEVTTVAAFGQGWDIAVTSAALKLETLRKQAGQQLVPIISIREATIAIKAFAIVAITAFAIAAFSFSSLTKARFVDINMHLNSYQAYSTSYSLQ